MVTKPTLPIHDLAARHAGLIPAVAEYYSEAARICFDRHHVSPVDIEIRNESETAIAFVEWERTTERIRGAHGNETDATVAGAYASVLAAVELAKGMVAVYRAETKTGADYYIAPSDKMPQDLES